MARTGVDENKQANQDLRTQQTTAYNKGQTSIDAGKAALQKLLSGQDIASNPFKRPEYLSSVNRLQGSSLDAAQESANAEMEAQNKRTGGLNSGATAGAMKDLALRKMRLGDQLSAERSSADYRSNLDYQQNMLQDIFQPAALESGYYGTSTGGRSSALNNLAQFGLASYGPWMAAISAAGTAAGGALGKPSSGSGGCWIAEAIYGKDDWRTHLLRSWLNAEFRRTWFGDLVMRFYLRFGERIAARARRSRWLRWLLRPLFELALACAVRERTVDLDSMRRAGV